nr:Chain A, Pin1 WW domain [unidentified]
RWFYFNRITGKRQFERPKGLVKGWEKRWD